MKPPEAPRSRLFHGWWVAFAAYTAAFGSVVFYNPTVLGVFVTPLESQFGWQRSQIALAVSLGSLGAAIIAPVAGLVMDRRGSRVAISFAALVMSVSALVISQAQLLWQFVVMYALGRAFATGAMQPAAFVALSNWFVRRRLFVSGIVSTAQRLGAALLPLVATLVIGLSGSWRAGWVALALIVATAGLPALLVMYHRPEDRGLRPDGDLVPAHNPHQTPTSVMAGEHQYTLSEATRTGAYWLVGAGTTLMVFCGPSINFHQIPHLTDQGLSSTEAAATVSAGSIIGALGGVLGGALASRITLRWTAVCSLLGMSLGIVLLLVARDLPTAAVFATLYGTSFGSQVALSQVVYAEYFGRRSMGLIRGSFQPIQLMMSAAGPYLVGLGFSRWGSYTIPFLVLSGLLIAAALAFSLARYPHRTAIAD